MGLYLVRAEMSRDTIKSFVAKPEDRTAALRTVVEAAGGKLLHLAYSASTGEVIQLVEMPSPVACLSYSNLVIGSGSVDRGSWEELMTPAQYAESMKGAGSLAAKYRLPGK